MTVDCTERITAFHVTGYQHCSTETINTGVGGTACNGGLMDSFSICLSLLILHELIGTNPIYLTTNSCQNISIYLASHTPLLLSHRVTRHMNYTLQTIFWSKSHFKKEEKAHKNFHITCDQMTDQQLQWESPSRCTFAYAFTESWCKHAFSSVQQQSWMTSQLLREVLLDGKKSMA